MHSHIKNLAVVLTLCTYALPVAADQTTHFFQTHRNEFDLEQRGDDILFANRQIGLAFKRSAQGFELTRVYGIERGQDFLAAATGDAFRNLFEIRMTLDPHYVQKDDRGKIKYGHFNILDQMAGDDPFIIGSNEANQVSWRREDRASESTLHLEWKNIDARKDKAVMDVEVTVTLRAGDPRSYWRINILNRSIYGTENRHYPRPTKYGIERVRFPLLSLAPIEKKEDNVFLYPKYRGELHSEPFRDGHETTNFYPHNFNMQFHALYNKHSKSGLYLGMRDPAASFMIYNIKHSDSQITWHPGHFPPNITFTGEDFDLPYDVVIGPFEGDWYDACQIYRQWAIQQFWCSKGKLSTRQDIATWYKHTPMFLYTALGDSAQGTHSLEENLIIAEQHFMEFLEWAGVPLPANYYEVSQAPPGRTAVDIPLSLYRRPRPGRWAGFSEPNAYAGNYPKIPVLVGLSESCKRLRKAGGIVCPYFGLELFDAGPTFNSPYAAESIPHLVRDLYGALRRWGAEASLQPCVATQWWRNRSKETCVLMLQRENVGGFYFDVLQGSGLPCYWTPHGHTAAGGDSMTRGMHDLVQIIAEAVKAEDPMAITTGENPSENMIGVTDSFLQVTLGPDNTAPIFATVYQDYILRYGLGLSVNSNQDAFFLECASTFVEGMQIGRIRLRPRDNSLSFQNPEHRKMLEFLGRIVGYYKQPEARKFLVYGQLLRPLTFKEPAVMPMLRWSASGPNQAAGAGKFPALMSGVFRSEDSDLGIFVVNASGDELSFRADLDPRSYGLAEGSSVDVSMIAPQGESEQVGTRTTPDLILNGSLPAHHMTMFRLRPQAVDK